MGKDDVGMSQSIQDSLYTRAAEVIVAARSQVRSAVNQAMVLTDLLAGGAVNCRR
jgi:hypothetical protein